MKRFPALWHVGLAFGLAVLNVVLRGGVTVFAILMGLVGVAELAWLMRVRRSKPGIHRREARGQAGEPDRGQPTHVWRDGRFVVVDPEEQETGE